MNPNQLQSDATKQNIQDKHLILNRQLDCLPFIHYSIIFKILSSNFTFYNREKLFIMSFKVSDHNNNNNNNNNNSYNLYTFFFFFLIWLNCNFDISENEHFHLSTFINFNNPRNCRTTCYREEKQRKGFGPCRGSERRRGDHELLKYMVWPPHDLHILIYLNSSRHS